MKFFIRVHFFSRTVQVLFIWTFFVVSAGAAEPIWFTASSQDVVYGYSSSRPGRLDELYKSYLKRALAVSLSSQHAIMVPYLSSQDVLNDILLEFSNKGDLIHNASPSYLPRHLDYYDRQMVTGSAKIIFIEEKDYKNEIRKRLNDLEGESLVVIFREESSRNLEIFADLKRYPIIIVTRHAHVQTGLNSDVYVALSRPEFIRRIIESKQSRSQFFGRSYGISLANYWRLQARNSSHVAQPIELNFEDQAMAPDLFDPLRNAPGFRSTPENLRFDLGTAQPNVRISLNLLQHARETLLSVSEVQGSVENWYNYHYGVGITRDQVRFTDGVSDAVMKLLQSLKPGAKVVIPSPGYFVYESLINRFGLKAIPIDLTKELFSQLSSLPSDVEGVIVNYPNNPFGKILDPTTGRQLASWAQATDKWVLNDLSNPVLGYDGRRVRSLLEFGKKGLIEVLGASKELGLTEVRVAAIVGDWQRFIPQAGGQLEEDLRLRLFARRLNQLMVNSNKAELINEFEMRRNTVVEAFVQSGWPKQAIHVPESGLNILLKIPAGFTSDEFARYLWDQAQIYVSAGDFISDNFIQNNKYVRVTLSESSEKLRGLPERLFASGLDWHSAGQFRCRLQKKLGQ